MEFLKLRAFPVNNVQKHITYGVQLSLTESVGIFKTGLPHLKGQGHLACRIAFFALCPLPVVFRIEHIRHHRIFQKAQGTAYSRRGQEIILAVIDPVVVLKKDYALHEIVAGRVPDIDGVRPMDEFRIGGESIRQQVRVQRVLAVIIVHPAVLGHLVFRPFHHAGPQGPEGVLGDGIDEERLHNEAGIGLAHIFRYADDASGLEEIAFQIRPLIYDINYIPHRRHLTGAYVIAHLDADIDFQTVVHLLQHRLLHIRLEDECTGFGDTDFVITAVVGVGLRIRHHESIGILVHKFLHILG